MLFFNCSIPRSGSELLQIILHQNPTIYASPTSPLLEYQFAARNNMNLAECKAQDQDLMAKAFIAMCKGMANSYYKPITSRPNIIDKNRGWSHYYEWVEQWNANPKMICMVRDLRSVMASMERIYRKTRHLPVHTDDPVNIQNMTVQDRVNYWLTTQPIGLAVTRLADEIQRGIDNKILHVRYEDLCNHPQQVMEKVYAYLELPLFQHDFDNIVKEVAEDDGHFGVYGSHKIRRKLEPVQSNSWDDMLSIPIAASIRQSVEWYFERFGY